MGCKLVTANNRNRMAVRLKVNIELPYDPGGPLLGLSPVKARIKKRQENDKQEKQKKNRKGLRQGRWQLAAAPLRRD